MPEEKSINELRNGFETFYQTVLKPSFSGLEATRKKYLRLFYCGLFLTCVAVPLIMLRMLSFYTGSDTSDFPAATLLFGIMVLVTLTATPIKLYKKKAKNQVMPEFIKYFGQFNYRYQACISEDILTRSLLFGEYNAREGDDFFIGRYKDTEMVISEEELSLHKVSADGKRRYKKVIFDGIIILLSMNKNFSGQTIVLKDRGLFNAFNKTGGLQKIALEDSRFEKEFEVYGSDQLEARYLLTTAFMERMLKVRDAYHAGKIQFSFFDNRLLIAVDVRQDMFETTSLFRSCTDRNMIDRAFEQFASVMEIIDILKLDKRLGM